MCRTHDQRHQGASGSKNRSEVFNLLAIINLIGNVRQATEDTGEVSASVQSLSADLDERAQRMRDDVKAFFDRLSA